MLSPKLHRLNIMNFNYPINIVNIDLSYYLELEKFYRENNRSTTTSLSFIIKNGNTNNVRPFITFENLNSNKPTIRCYPLSSFNINSDSDLRRKMHHFIIRYPASIPGKILLNCPIDIPKQFISIINTNVNDSKTLPYSERSWVERCNDEKKHCLKHFKFIQSQINEYFVFNKKDPKSYQMINKYVIEMFNKKFY